MEDQLDGVKVRTPSQESEVGSNLISPLTGSVALDQSLTYIEALMPLLVQ